MRTTFDLPDDLVKEAKIAAVKRGSTLRDMVAEGLRRVLKDTSVTRKRMTKPPVQLPPGHTVPLRSNEELAQILDQEDNENLNDMYRGR